MGAHSVFLEADTKAELRERLEAKRQEASDMGLYEDRKSKVERNPKTGKLVIYIRFHT